MDKALRLLDKAWKKVLKARRYAKPEYKKRLLELSADLATAWLDMTYEEKMHA